MTHKEPSEQAMKNIYLFLARVLPKYLNQEEPKINYKEQESKEHN